MAKKKEVGKCPECGGKMVKSKTNDYRPVCTVCGE